MTSESSQSKGLSSGSKAVIAVLLIIPFIIYLSLPTYNYRYPELLGVPFFYWYQTLWLALSAVLFFIAAYIWERGR